MFQQKEMRSKLLLLHMIWINFSLHNKCTWFVRNYDELYKLYNVYNVHTYTV